MFSIFGRKSFHFETMWENIVETHIPQNTIQCGAGKIRFTCRVTTTNYRYAIIILKYL